MALTTDLDNLIRKVERITSANQISMDEYYSLIDYLSSLDPENILVLDQFKENKIKILDNTIEVLKYYNVIQCNLSQINKRTKIISEHGKLVKIPFDIFRHNTPDHIINIIEKIKKCC